MRKLMLAALISVAVAGCNAGSSSSLGSFVTAGQQIASDVCNEGQAIQTAATTPQGLAAAAQAGFSASKVSSKVSNLNAKLQGYCALGAILTPVAADAVKTASAAVLSTGAAPPALVAAVKGS